MSLDTLLYTAYIDAHQRKQFSYLHIEYGKQVVPHPFLRLQEETHVATEEHVAYSPPRQSKPAGVPLLTTCNHTNSAPSRTRTYSTHTRTSSYLTYFLHIHISSSQTILPTMTETSIHTTSPMLQFTHEPHATHTQLLFLSNITHLLTHIKLCHTNFINTRSNLLL